VLPHKNVEIVGWVSAAEERASGEIAAAKRSGRDAEKRCSLTAPKNVLKERQASAVPCTASLRFTLVFVCMQL
jgi:hypothetical protein